MSNDNTSERKQSMSMEEVVANYPEQALELMKKMQADQDKLVAIVHKFGELVPIIVANPITPPDGLFFEVGGLIADAALLTKELKKEPVV